MKLHTAIIKYIGDDKHRYVWASTGTHYIRIGGLKIRIGNHPSSIFREIQFGYNDYDFRTDYPLDDYQLAIALMHALLSREDGYLPISDDNMHTDGEERLKRYILKKYPNVIADTEHRMDEVRMLNKIAEGIYIEQKAQQKAEQKIKSNIEEQKRLNYDLTDTFKRISNVAHCTTSVTRKGKFMNGDIEMLQLTLEERDALWSQYKVADGIGGRMKILELVPVQEHIIEVVKF